MLNAMGPMLNRHIPFDAVVRWWFILIAGATLGFVFSFVTGVEPFNAFLEGSIAEGPPSAIEVANKWVVHPGWKHDILFTVIGFLLGCGVVWLLEEIRLSRQPVGDP